MKITKSQLRAIIREQDEATLDGNVIGSISADIDGDHRYNQQLVVSHNPNTDEITVVVQDASAVGGMDYQGPGEGRSAYHTTGRQVLPAGTNGKGLIAAIRYMIKRRADTIKMYGRPSRNFTWGSSPWSDEPKGLNVRLATDALRRARGLGENKMRITKGQLRRIIKEERSRLLNEQIPPDDPYASVGGPDPSDPSHRPAPWDSPIGDSVRRAIVKLLDADRKEIFPEGDMDMAAFLMRLADDLKAGTV